MEYKGICIAEARDRGRVDKLIEIGRDEFWEHVRHLTCRTSSDHALGRWQALADQRWEQLTTCPDCKAKMETINIHDPHDYRIMHCPKCGEDWDNDNDNFVIPF